MYRFINTNEEIQESEIVLKQLKELEEYDATVEIKRCIQNGKTCFSCTIKGDGIIMKATTSRPEVSAGQACDGFVVERRQNKNKLVDKRIDRKRKADEHAKDAVLEDVEFN